MVSISREAEALFTLLQAGLWEQEPDNLEVFPLFAGEWWSVFRMARMQTVTGIVYRGICHLPDCLLPPDDILVRWLAEADAIERKNKKMDVVLANLYALFRRNGIQAVLQKGQGVAQFYEYPCLRICGDIDFYFPDKEEAKRADALVKGGERKPDGSLCYLWNGIVVEHHRYLTDLNNPYMQDFIEGYAAACGYHSFRLTASEEVEIKVPAPTVNLLLLDVHLLKHALGRGIGLRQFCDMARAYYRLCHVVDFGEITRLYTMAGIWKWSNLLHSFLSGYLALPSACLPPSGRKVSPDKLANKVLREGNFGQQAVPLPSMSRLRKLQTLQAFFRNAGFAFRYAPGEAYWTLLNLVKGNFSRE